MRVDALVSPRPTAEDLEEACRETEHAVLAIHRQTQVPLVLWRNGRVVKLDSSDPCARVPGAAPPKH